MSSILPPSPQGVPPGHAFWNIWYEKLRTIINNIATSIQWVNLNFTGSKIEDIVSRDHNKLTAIQGGTTAEYYHLTNSQHIRVNDLANPDIIGTDLALSIKPKAASITQPPGRITISGRDAVASSHNGGEVTLSGGQGGSSGLGGSVTCTGGAGKTGGSVNFTGGTGDTVAGEIYITGGSSYTSGGVGGGFQFIGGSCTEPGGKGGDIFIATGQGNTTGGTISLSSALGATPSIQVTDNGTAALLGFYGATPVPQPSTSGGSATFVANAGTAVNDASTFDGYTIKQVVKALKNLGILA